MGGKKEEKNVKEKDEIGIKRKKGDVIGRKM